VLTVELKEAIFRETNKTFNLISFEEDKLALTRLINQANATINIYSHVLCPKIFDTKTIVLALKEFCLKHHRTQVNILVNESRPITRVSHRLLGLSHRHSSSISFKTINPEVSSREDDFVCFDKSAYFQLSSYQHFSATCNFADAEHTARFSSFFSDAWERSETDAEFRSTLL
jgi:hypothetical protein